MRIVAIEVPVRSLRRKSTLRKWFLRPVLRCRCFVALLDANLGDLARCDREPSNSEAGFDFHIHFATGIVFEPCQNRQKLFEPGTREELDFFCKSPNGSSPIRPRAVVSTTPVSLTQWRLAGESGDMFAPGYGGRLRSAYTWIQCF